LESTTFADTNKSTILTSSIFSNLTADESVKICFKSLSDKSLIFPPKIFSEIFSAFLKASSPWTKVVTSLARAFWASLFSGAVSDLLSNSLISSKVKKV